MREHTYVRHKTSTSLVEASQVRNKARKLKAIRRSGMWAYVSVPDEDPDGICEIHYWHRADKEPDQVALMIGHELGHIADGGPKDHLLGHTGEEGRADEFARAAWEAIKIVIATGMLIDPREVARSVRRSKPSES